jgi:hypothetical protein
MHLWDHLIQQATLILNLLRPSQRNPRVSAYTMLEGTFNFNKTPMAPPGTKVVIHKKSPQRASYDPHGIDGWYLGPTMEHYRCYSVFTNKTQSERTSDRVEFPPQHTKVLYMSAVDIAIQAASDLTHVLQHPLPAHPFSPVDNQQLEALKQLVEIFQHNTSTTSSPTRVPLSRPPPLPRVPLASPTPLPRVPSPKHCYPTRHSITQSSYNEANIVQEITDINSNLAATHEPLQHQALTIIDPDTGASMEYRHLMKSPAHKQQWTRSFSNELRRLAQGIGGRIKGTSQYHLLHCI